MSTRVVSVRATSLDRLTDKIARAAGDAEVVSVSVSDPPAFSFGLQRWTATVVLRQAGTGGQMRLPGEHT